MTGRHTSSNSQYSLLRFITSKQFWIHLCLILMFLVGCTILTFLWLKLYTRHNQQLELPDYVGYQLSDAERDAQEKNFRLQVLDSIHIVGRPGHEILYQNPVAQSLVKENRTIYVTISKFSADKIPVSRLPVLYGKSYSRKQSELLQSFEIKSKIVGRQYDPGEPDQILMVIYNGDTIIDRRGRLDEVMIEKGTTLEYIVSHRKGGRLEIPDLLCKTFAEAKFLIANSGLVLGEVITDGQIGAVDSAYVSGQVPDPEEGSMLMGQEIRLSLSKYLPSHCQ